MRIISMEFTFLFVQPTQRVWMTSITNKKSYQQQNYLWIIYVYNLNFNILGGNNPKRLLCLFVHHLSIFHFIKWRVVLQKHVRNRPTYNPVSALEGQKAPRAPITPQSTWYIYIIYVCVYGYVYIYTYKTNHETNYEASNGMYFSYAPCLEWRPPWWAPWWCCWPCPATRRPGSSATTASKRCTSLACKFCILFQKLKWNPFKCLLTWYSMFVFLQDNDKILIYYQA